MKKKKPKGIKTFFRAFSLTLLVCLCPLILLFGIAVADKNTREVALGTDTPAVSVEQQDGVTTFSLFGRQWTIPPGFLDGAQSMAEKILPFIPPEVRLALSGVQELFSGESGTSPAPDQSSP